MFIRQRYPRVDQVAMTELRFCFPACSFERQLREGGCGCVVAQTGVVEINGGPLDGSYDKVADCWGVLI